MKRNSRRQKRAWILLLDADSWQLLPPEPTDEPPVRNEFPPERLAEQAAEIQQSLIVAGWRSEPLVIGLSANLCLAATVDVPTPAMLRKRQAMRFHLEGWIPWPAEEFVTDYVSHKTSAFMVAVRIDPLKELLSGLEKLDVTPAALTPAAFLAVQQHISDASIAGSSHVLWKHGSQLELVGFQDGHVQTWRHLESADAPSLLALCSVEALEHYSESPWVVRDVESTTLDLIRSQGISVTSENELPWDTALRSSANAIAAGMLEPLIDLRRDELAGERPSQAVAPQLLRVKIAAAAAILAVCGSLWIRGDRYADATAEVRTQLTDVFVATFPKEPPPERVLPAMRKAHALLQGTRGPVKELPAGPSADQLLERLLVALPNDLRYRAPEIRIEGSTVSLGGEVRSNADADRIAASIRAGGFEVDSPRTQRLAEQGFAVRLAGQVSGAPDKREAGSVR